MALLEIPSRRSFGRQIILTFVVGFFLLISAFAALLILTERENLHRDSVIEATSMAQSLAASALPWVLADDVAGLQEVVQAFRAYPEFNSAMVVSPDGRVLAHSDPSKTGMFLADEQSKALLKSPHAIRVMEDSALLIEVAVPIEIGGRQVGWARVSSTKLGNTANLHAMIIEIAVFLLISTILSFIAAMLIANRLGRRIGSLVQVAEGVQAGNVSARAITSGGEDEVARLGISLNKMLDVLSRNEHDLRVASHYTRSLIEASLDPLVTISAEGKITDVNRATEKATGRSRTELIGTDFSDYFTEPDKAREGYRQVFALGFVTDYPLTLRHSDGHVTDVLYNASVYRDEAGKVLGVFAAARDVTERNKAEAAMRESEALLQATIKILPVGLWVIGADRNIVFSNDAAKQIWAGARYVGIEQLGEYKGWRMDNGKPVGAHEWAGARALEKGETIIGEEIEIEAFDGTSKIILDSAVPLRNADGSIRCAVTINQDITERKRSESRLLESTARARRFSDALDNVSAYVYIKNRQRQYVHANKPTLELFHCSAEELLGSTDSRFFPPDTVAHLRQTDDRVLEHGESTHDEIKVIDSSGKPIYYWEVKTPIYESDGTIWGLCGISYDITERKQAEMALQQSEEVLREAQRIAHLGSWHMDVATNEVVWSEELYKIYGFDPALPPPLYTESMKLFTPESWERLNAAVTRAREAGIPYEIELETVQKDGGRGWMWARGEPVRDAHGAVVRVRGVVMNITERKKLEIQHRQSFAYTRSLIEASLDPLVTISAQGKITDVNEATEKATGRSRSELIGTDFSNYFTEPDKAREGYRQVFAKGFVTDYPLALRHRDGHVTDVLYNASVYSDEAGKVLGVFAAARDITERKKSEEELAQLSLQNRLILDSAGEGIYGLDVGGRITFINPAASQMLGFGAGELVGQFSHSTFHHTKPDGSPYPEEECPVHAAYKEGVVRRGNDLYWRKDGSSFPSEFISTPILEAGKLTGAVVTFRDITERIHAENALREKEERLSLATVINGVGIWDWNLRTQEMIWDDSMYALYHIRREDFIGTEEAWRKSLHPDDLLRGDKEVADAISGIKPFDTEFRVVWPSGEIHHIKAVARVFRDEHGTPVRMLGTNIDITETKKAEEALFEAQQVFRTLVENSPDIIARYDRDCRRTYVNPTYLKAAQIAQRELLSTSPAQLSPLPKASSTALQNLLRKVLDSGVAEAIDVIWPKDGDVDSWYNIYAFPEYDREGRVVSVMTVSRDITERKQVEEELKERERHSLSLLRLSRNMERAQTYSDVMNAARDEVRSIIGYQNMWAYLFTEDKKHAKAIVASGPTSDFVMSEEGTATLTIEGDRMLEEIAASKEIIVVSDAQTDERVNKEIVAKMGLRTIVNIPIILFDRHFGCVGTGTVGEEGVRTPSRSEQKYLMALASHMAAALDRIHLLAERKLAEDEVKALNRDLEQRVVARTAELQAANKELEAFSYSVSHDLRSPLRAIDGFSHILLDDYADKLDDEGKRLLNVVRNNTGKMGKLIDDILKFSRAGRLEMNFSEIDMDELARDVYEELLPTVAGQNLQVDIEPLPPSKGDRAMMRQVLVNLMSNAIKFTRGKEQARIKVGAYTEINETVYFVQDNGAGFDMRYVDRLFGVFQRLHTESEFEGTGIGLAIVKRIVARHGGRTWAEGKIDEGATIYFALPAAAAAPG